MGENGLAKAEQLEGIVTQDLKSLLKRIEHAHAEKIPLPKFNRADRMALITELLDEGMPKLHIASFLGIARSTLYEDLNRISELYENGYFRESADQTAERINRRYDYLYAKAIETNDYRLALSVENDRLKALQSIGMVVKDAERVEIEHTDATKEKAIEIILGRVGLIDGSHGEPNPGTVQE